MAADVAWQMRGAMGMPGGMSQMAYFPRMAMPNVAAAVPAGMPQMSPAASLQQKAVMSEIYSAVQQGNMTHVANTLTQAIHNRVNLPNQFLAGVKQWMDAQRSGQAAQQALTPRPPVPPVQAPVPQVPHQAQIPTFVQQAAPAGLAAAAPQIAAQKNSAFSDLHLRLEQAISKGDQEAMKSVLEEAAVVAAQRMAPGAATPTNMPPILPLSAAQSASPPARQSNVAPPAVAASSQAWPSAAPPGIAATSQVSWPTPASTAGTASGSQTLVKTFSDPDAYGPGDAFGVEETEIAFQTEAAKPRSDAEVKEEMRRILERQQDKQATLRKLSVVMRIKVDRVSKIAESDKSLFAVFNKGQHLRLMDAKSRQVMNEFRKLLMRAGRGPGLVHSSAAAETVPKLVHYAMQANAMDVALQLLALKQVILRRQKGETPFGMLSSNTPLLLACLIDQIVATDRRQGRGHNFEEKLGSIVHSLIFQGWVMGNTPGSQFLTNLLLTWSRLGYFEPQQLEKCKKSLMLFIQYAPIEGVPDAPDKPRGTGWYAIVKRPRHEREGCEAVNPQDAEEVAANGEVKEDNEPKEDDGQVMGRRATFKGEDSARPLINLTEPPAKRQRSESGVGARSA